MQRSSTPICRSASGARSVQWMATSDDPTATRAPQCPRMAATMKRAELAAMLDHSVLKPESSASDIAGGIDVVRRFQIGFYCVQPCWVRMASNALAAGDTRVVSVVGFPHGCDLPAVKAFAALRAVQDG